MASGTAQLEIELGRRRQALRAGLSRYGRRLEADLTTCRTTAEEAARPVAAHPGLSISLAAGAGFAAAKVSNAAPHVPQPFGAGVAAAEDLATTALKVAVSVAARTWLANTAPELTE